MRWRVEQVGAGERSFRNAGSARLLLSLGDLIERFVRLRSFYGVSGTVWLFSISCNIARWYGRATQR